VREARQGYAIGRFASQAEVQRFMERCPHFPKDLPCGGLRPMTVSALDPLISDGLGGSRHRKRSGDMSDLFWLSDAQMARLEPYFPKSHGKPRVDDRRVLSGIIFINRNGLRWRDAPAEYGPHKTLYNRWKRWSDKGVFARIMAGLAAEHREKKTVMIDATYLKAHRTATSMGVKKGGAAA
jgi:transposase